MSDQAGAWEAYETARLLEQSNIEMGRFTRATEHKERHERIAAAWPQFVTIFNERYGK